MHREDVLSIKVIEVPQFICLQTYVGSRGDNFQGLYSGITSKIVLDDLCIALSVGQSHLKCPNNTIYRLSDPL